MNRRLVAIFASLFVSFGVLTPAVGALAQVSAGGHDDSSVEELVVGTFYDLDYACAEDDPTISITTLHWDSAPVLPSGLIADSSTFHISGTPTETGDYYLPAMWCHRQGPGVNEDVTRNVGAIQVASTVDGLGPAASVTIFPLNNSKCEFALAIDYPTGFKPDGGTQFLRITDEFGGAIEFSGLNDRQSTFDIFSADNLIDSSEDTMWSYHGAPTDSGVCQSNIRASVTYLSAGLPSVISVSKSKWVSTPIELSLDVYKNYKEDGGCQATFYYTVGEEPDYLLNVGRALQFTYTEPGLQAVIKIDNVHLGNDGFVAFSLSDGTIWSDTSRGNMVSMLSFTGASDNCGQNGRLETSIVSNGVPLGYVEYANGLLPCGKGTYSISGFSDSQSPCIAAAVATFANSAGLKAATPCPTGMITDGTGSASINDCYKPVTQTVSKLAKYKVMKFGSKITVSSLTDQAKPAKFKASGSCVAKASKVKGKPIVTITAAKKAGFCKLAVSAPGGGRVLALTKVLKIKVSKTGK